jgi:hypothetical protein
MKFSQGILFLNAVILAASANAFTNKPNFQINKDSSKKVGVFDFFKDAKKNLVKSIAGDYDEVAIKARIDGLVEDNAVLMFSFTT